jgi:tetratricopeptide (TPR) repeat protein
MAAPSKIALSIVLAVISCGAQLVPNSGNSTSNANTAKPLPQPRPEPPPLPPDVKTPDAPPGETSSGHSVRRTLKKLAPNCINSIFHACWSSPPEKPQPPQTDERKGGASRDVGEFYFDRGNYRAAESRFVQALQFNPSDPRAMYDLARSLQKLNQAPQAISRYQACIDLEPAGLYADRSRKALQDLTRADVRTH